MGAYSLYSFFIVVFIFLGGIPCFLSELPYELGSAESAIACAKKHAKKSWKYLCELLTLVTTVRTYRLLVKSSLFSFLLPAACMAEANPFRGCGTKVRFWVGFIVWWGFLFVGAVVAAMNVSSGTVELLIAGVVAIVLLILCMVSLSFRPVYWTPLQASLKTFSFTWSNSCALITGKKTFGI